MLEKLAQDLKKSTSAEEQGAAVMEAKSNLLDLLVKKAMDY